MERRTEITLLGDSILKGIQVDPKTRGYQVRNDIGIPELEAEFNRDAAEEPENEDEQEMEA